MVVVVRRIPVSRAKACAYGRHHRINPQTGRRCTCVLQELLPTRDSTFRRYHETATNLGDGV